MKSMIFTALFLLAGTQAFAGTSNCRVQLSTFMPDLLNAEVKDRLNAQIQSFLKERSDITHVTENPDYIVKFSFWLFTDPHSARVMPQVSFDGTVAGTLASEFADGIALKPLKPRKAQNGKLFTAPLNRLLNQYLVSCEALKKASQAAGDGTLDLSLGTEVTTPTHDVFKRIEDPLFPQPWLAPNGLIWSQALPGLYSNLDLDGTHAIDGMIQKSEATEACKAIGGRLPTQAEYDQFISYFGPRGKNRLNANGQYLLNAMFPYQKKGVWTSTATSDGLAADFAHYVGFTTQSSQRWWKLLVRCVK